MPGPHLAAEARRGLVMLAGSEAGCAATLVLAHGFFAKLIAGLIKANSPPRPRDQ